MRSDVGKRPVIASRMCAFYCANGVTDHSEFCTLRKNATQTRGYNDRNFKSTALGDPRYAAALWKRSVSAVHLDIARSLHRRLSLPRKIGSNPESIVSARRLLPF